MKSRSETKQPPPPNVLQPTTTQMQNEQQHIHHCVSTTWRLCLTFATAASANQPQSVSTIPVLRRPQGTCHWPQAKSSPTAFFARRINCKICLILHRHGCSQIITDIAARPDNCEQSFPAKLFPNSAHGKKAWTEIKPQTP